MALTPGPADPEGNASFSGSATVPAAIFAQLKARDVSYPIKWGPEDDDASWLKPARLLLFLQLNCSTGRSGASPPNRTQKGTLTGDIETFVRGAGACDDTMPASLTVDGKAIDGIKAYESRCTECTCVLLTISYCCASEIGFI